MTAAPAQSKGREVHNGEWGKRTKGGERGERDQRRLEHRDQQNGDLRMGEGSISIWDRKMGIGGRFGGGMRFSPEKGVMWRCMIVLCSMASLELLGAAWRVSRPLAVVHNVRIEDQVLTSCSVDMHCWHPSLVRRNTVKHNKTVRNNLAGRIAGFYCRLVDLTKPRDREPMLRGN